MPWVGGIVTEQRKQANEELLRRPERQRRAADGRDGSYKHPPRSRYRDTIPEIEAEGFRPGPSLLDEANLRPLREQTRDFKAAQRAKHGGDIANDVTGAREASAEALVDWLDEERFDAIWAVADQTKDATDAVQEVVERYHRKWKSTTNDEDPMALALQRAAEEEFGLAGAAPWQMTDDLARQVDDLYGTEGAAMRAALRTWYDATQDALGDLPGNSVVLSRGVYFDEALLPADLAGLEVGESAAIELQLRPMSSFTTDPDLALDWAGDGRPSEDYRGFVISAVVPKEAIAATPTTGFGTIREAEMVVHGGRAITVLVERLA